MSAIIRGASADAAGDLADNGPSAAATAADASACDQIERLKELVGLTHCGGDDAPTMTRSGCPGPRGVAVWPAIPGRIVALPDRVASPRGPWAAGPVLSRRAVASAGKNGKQRNAGELVFGLVVNKAH